MSQSLACLFVHVIFSTKNRQRFIQPEIKQSLYNYITGICEGHETLIHEIGGIEDHLHILLSLPRTLALSSLIEEIKKSSSKWMKEKGKFYEDFSWQRGYGAFSIGQSNFDALKSYIRTQEEHHKKISFEEEYLLFLKKYRVDFDEKHLWKE